MAKAARYDVVFIRKSTQGQDEGGQMANVRGMLRELGTSVPEQHWFIGTVSRRKVKANADFNRLMDLVEADRVRTVYVESQDRWGTADRPELFSLLGVLRLHETRLYDLRAKKDLTERDLATEMLAFVNSIKSEKELQDISYRSLRTRVNNFKNTASWPTGPHPFGYGKACHGPDGKLLWVWQPTSRTLGQVHTPGPDGTLHAGPDNIKIPRKTKYDKIVLVPSSNPAYTQAVRMVFDMYTRVGLSRRQISVRLNREGHRFYANRFSHTYVTQLLGNPAYAGDTHFGKTQSGDLHTFDANGMMVELRGHKETKTQPRAVADRLVKENTHEALIDRDTWKLAQAKLASEQARTSHAPRNPAYYLKQLFVCGHCGKNMTGRTEIDAKTKKKIVMYVCSTYVNSRCGGYPVECGYHRISHDDAERMLLDKIGELQLQFDNTASDQARANIQKRIANLGHEDAAEVEQWQSWLHAGVDALMDYLSEVYNPDTKAFMKLRKLAASHFWEDELEAWQFDGLPLKLEQFKAAVAEAEEFEVGQASRKLAALKVDHQNYTKAWVKASDLQQAILKEETDKLESEIAIWQPRAVRLSERLQALYDADAERRLERTKLLAEWPALECLEKGEAMRRLFQTITLFWDRTYHAARTDLPIQRKTDRPGRYRYKLDQGRTKWTFITADLGGTW